MTNRAHLFQALRVRGPSIPALLCATKLKAQEFEIPTTPAVCIYTRENELLVFRPLYAGNVAEDSIFDLIAELASDFDELEFSLSPLFPINSNHQLSIRWRAIHNGETDYVHVRF